jgi:hypothetical protein
MPVNTDVFDYMLVTVRHTGTRYVRDNLRRWNLNVRQMHVDHRELPARWGTTPAIVTIRNPEHSFLSWWKRTRHSIDEFTFKDRFFAQWAELDVWLNTPTPHPIFIYHVDREPVTALAAQLNVVPPPVPPHEMPLYDHHILNQWVALIKPVPQELSSLCTRWGYPPPQNVIP